MRGLMDEILRAGQDVEFHSRRAQDASRRLHALLREYDRPAPKRPLESSVSIYFCRVPESFTADSLREHFRVHGELIDFFFHEKSRWGKATYQSSSDQANCLSQQDFYQNELGITVQPHKEKRIKI